MVNKTLPIILTIFSTFLVFSLSAQEDSKIKWGKIPEADLAMTSYELDPNADALVLADIGELKIDYSGGSARFRLDHHKRIKIFSRSGFDQGDIQIRFYSYSNIEKIEQLKIFVFAPDGTKTVVDKSAIYEEEENEYWSVIKIAVPNLQEGSVIEYRYSLLSERLLTLSPWSFQEDIPVRWSQLYLEIPEWFDYVYLKQGADLYKEEDAVVRKSFSVPRRLPDGNGFYIERGHQTINVNCNTRSFVMKDVPALKEESYITTMHDYYARVQFQLKSVQYPDSQGELILTTWTQVCNELNNHEYFGLQLNKSHNYNDAWRGLKGDLNGISDPMEKANAIYNALSKRMNWDGFRGIYVDKSLNDTFRKRSGSSGELNLLLIAMLREAGLTAYPLLVSTRRHGQVFEPYPFLAQFNHVLAVTLIGDEAILMDLGDANRPSGLLAIESLNSRALVMNPDNPTWISIPATTSKDVYYAVMSVNETGDVEGTMKTSHEGYSALYYRDALVEQSAESIWQETLNADYSGCTLEMVSVDGIDDVYSKIKQEFTFSLPNAGQAPGDFIYINPVVLSDYRENPFTLEARSYPVDIPYPVEDKYIFNLTIPEGYLIEEMPEPIRLVMEGNKGLFQYNISERAGSVQVVIEIKLTGLFYPADEYSVIKNFFDIIVEKLNEPVVLKRQ